MIKIWDKYKIKSDFIDDIKQSYEYFWEKIPMNIINWIWIISNIPDIYKNIDLSYYDLDEVMFNFKNWDYEIWLNLSEVREYKEKQIKKYLKNQLELWVNIVKSVES